MQKDTDYFSIIEIDTDIGWNHITIHPEQFTKNKGVIYRIRKHSNVLNLISTKHSINMQTFNFFFCLIQVIICT